MLNIGKIYLNGSPLYPDLHQIAKEAGNMVDLDNET